MITFIRPVVGTEKHCVHTANLAARKIISPTSTSGHFRPSRGVVFVSEHSECSEVYDECVMPTNSATPWGGLGGFSPHDACDPGCTVTCHLLASISDAVALSQNALQLRMVTSISGFL